MNDHTQHDRMTLPDDKKAPDRLAPRASDVVFFGIVNGLESRDFVAGQRLIEVDLAKRFGVGRNSVREALQRLAADGIVDIIKHKGAVVRSLSLKETLDVLDVAEQMTGLLAWSACRAVAQGSSTQELEQTLGLLAKCHTASETDQFAKVRRHFYKALLELSGNDELRRMLRTIHVPVVYAQHRLGSLQQIRLLDYQNIAAAVLGGKLELAAAAGKSHVQRIRTEIMKLETEKSAID